MSTPTDSIEQKPNLVFVITDDQGYGDFQLPWEPDNRNTESGCHAQAKAFV